jgi:hypothetical protein
MDHTDEYTLTIRKSGTKGKSAHVTIPYEYMTANNLNPGDLIRWVPEADGIKLRFARVAQVFTPHEVADLP